MKKKNISDQFDFNAEKHKAVRSLWAEAKKINKHLSEIIAQQDQRLSAEKKLRQATRTFSRALQELNIIYAQQNLGAVEIEDVLLHDCIDQTALNRSYTRHQAYPKDKPQTTADDERTL